jgi:hypothetical protein
MDLINSVLDASFSNFVFQLDGSLSFRMLFLNHWVRDFHDDQTNIEVPVLRHWLHLLLQSC